VIFLKKISEQTGVIIVHLLQDVGNHDVTDKCRFTPDRILFTELVDQRKFLLVEKDGLAITAHQTALPLAPEIRRKAVFLRFLLPGHTYYIYGIIRSVLRPHCTRSP